MKYFAGIDLGGVSAKAGLFDENAKPLAKGSVPTSKNENYVTVVAKMAQLVHDMCAKAGIKAVNAAGIASPGIIDGKNGLVVGWSNFGWKDKPLAADLSAALGCPVRLGNDANVAALGEAKFGAGKKYEDSILVTLGTGIGSGIIIGGRIFEGYRGGGAEAGHMTVVVGGIPCPCGRRGCFEQYASASALIRDTKRAMFEHKNSALWELTGGNPELVDGKTAFEAARAGDACAQQVVKNYVLYLSEGLANLINLFRPQAVMLGGGISGEGEYLLQPVRKCVSERIAADAERIPLVIVRAQLGGDAGIWGAYALSREG